MSLPTLSSISSRWPELIKSGGDYDAPAKAKDPCLEVPRELAATKINFFKILALFYGPIRVL